MRRTPPPVRRGRIVPKVAEKDTTIDPVADVADDVEVRGRATVGPRARLSGEIVVAGTAHVDTPVNTRADFYGDAYAISPEHWFQDSDPVAPHTWTVYRTQRGSWQGCCGCVKGIDIWPDPSPVIDFDSPEWTKGEQDYADHRRVQLARVQAECQRRDQIIRD